MPLSRRARGFRILDSVYDIVQPQSNDHVFVDDTAQSGLNNHAFVERLSSPNPISPAPGRSTRLKSTINLSPGFVYNF